MKRSAPATDGQDVLKRELAGRYRTADGRFTVEQSSGGWVLTDSDQANDFGLPLTRGPYATLGAAKAALGLARGGERPTSNLPSRIAAFPQGSPTGANGGRRRAPQAVVTRPAPPIQLREFRAADADALRVLWSEAGMASFGDDDLSLRRFAQRNPGLFVVAVRGASVVGSALGAWDGRRGWIYHVTAAATERRLGLGTRIVREVEARLRALGCPKVNVVIRDDNDDGAAFWEALGYGAHGARLRGRVLDE